MKSIIPTMPEILREAIIVSAGALIAAVVIKQLPPNVRALFYFNQGGQNG